MSRPNGPLVLLGAGGTAGHLFPAEALAAVLTRRGITVDLATDARASRYQHSFPARDIHIIPSETLRARNPVHLAKTTAALARGLLRAWFVLARLRPAVVVGFGGYPTLPTLMAASLRGLPTIIHEQNAVMGRANRLLAPRVRAIATSFPEAISADPAIAAKSTMTGNPVRPAVIEDSGNPYPELDPLGRMNLLVFGGSQGARIMADVVPAAIERLDPRVRARLSLVQQARAEDIDRVRQIYLRLGVTAEIADFFADLPARMAAAHLVVARGGASTVAELAVIGRRRSGAAATCARSGPTGKRQRACEGGRRCSVKTARLPAGAAGSRNRPVCRRPGPWCKDGSMRALSRRGGCCQSPG